MHLRPFYFLALIAFAACTPSAEETSTPLTIEAWQPLKIDGVPLKVQIAITLEEQRKGLMHRDSLPENGGMLFIDTVPNRKSFWMANTRIPLDIGFFDNEGVLREIHHMLPYDSNQTVSHSSDIQFSLEMNNGWFASQLIYPGARLDLQALAKALRARGADPEKYGIPEK